MIRGIHWFRRDLRLRDNTSLCALAEAADEWLPVFVIDPRLAPGGASDQPRLRFLFDCLERLGAELHKRGLPLVVRSGNPEDVIPELMQKAGATVLSFGTGATPFATDRDARVRTRVESAGGRVIEQRDDAILAGGEVLSKTGQPYRVYTPYRNAWWQRWEANPRLPVGIPRLPRPIPGFEKDEAPTLVDRLHAETLISLPTGSVQAAKRRLKLFLQDRALRYSEDRDRPDRDGTSQLSPHLRMGTLSARECFAAALEARSLRPEIRAGVDKWLDELIWREFYIDLALAEPHILRGNAKPEYDAMQWNDDPAAFEAWSEGRTGYPIVDAGMRQLRQTGWMHNRVRMIVASFLTKDLLIDWRRGERLFMDLLVDGDPTSNNGGWQWSASTGSDAQPYFRIFNPVTQGQRYDPDGEYVKRWVPELRSVPGEFVHAPWKLPRPPKRYPAPIVEHAERRKLALERYGQARANGASE